MSVRCSKPAKIELSKKIFYHIKYFSKIDCHFRIQVEVKDFTANVFDFLKFCLIFMDWALCLSTKYNNFIGVCSILVENPTLSSKEESQ